MILPPQQQIGQLWRCWRPSAVLRQVVGSACCGFTFGVRVRMSKTHRDLWPGIHLKLDKARFHLGRMAHALRAPEPTPQNLALLASTGANFDHTRNWHREFYAHLDAFLWAAHPRK